MRSRVAMGRRHGLAVAWFGLTPGAALAAAAGVVRAGDVHDLNRGLPLDVEDTVTAERGQVQLQGSARYEHQSDGGDLLFLEPQVQVGVLDYFHFELSYPIIAGDGDRSGAGDFIVAGLYRFLDEKSPGFGDDPWPSLAVKGVGFGIGDDSPDVRLTVGIQYSF